MRRGRSCGVSVCAAYASVDFGKESHKLNCLALGDPNRAPSAGPRYCCEAPSAGSGVPTRGMGIGDELQRLATSGGLELAIASRATHTGSLREVSSR
jgi:hypothetical protein